MSRYDTVVNNLPTGDLNAELRSWYTSDNMTTCENFGPNSQNLGWSKHLSELVYDQALMLRLDQNFRLRLSVQGGY